jgi:phosphonate transport system substrate-binding protein
VPAPDQGKSGTSPARRRFVSGAVGLGAAALLAHPVRGAPAAIRIGTTAVILDDQLGFLDAWRAYLEAKLGRGVTFVQRGSYREITQLIFGGQLDFAWVCGFPYARNKSFMRLLAMPLYRRKPLYQSYLIVPQADRDTRSFRDLRGLIFAYSDPDSNSGFLVPQFDMLREGLDPPAHFRKSFFTYAHRKVVAAVATGVAQGGAVDGYVWETLALRFPEQTAKTRVARRSDEYGFPPLVARRSLDEPSFAAMQATLVGMSSDPVGQGFLKELNLDGFAPGEERVFDSIARAMEFVSARQPLR